MTLKEFFAQHPKVALGFSGGVDSAFLLWAACTAGAEVYAFHVHSPFQPAFELTDAKNMARELGASMEILELDPLDCPEVAANPKNRCYYCKKQIFGNICAEAAKRGIPCVIEGTNASDEVDDRPGYRALQELGVLSPLKLCGLTKSEIRRLSQEHDLFTWNKPAYACLATRIPTGTPITHALLEKTEQAETALMDLGFSDFRVRYLDGRAKLQLPESQFLKALELRKEILETLGPLYKEVLLDMEARP